jgi:glycerate 2-kinase
MIITIAVDSFKSTLSSLEASLAVSRGVKKLFPTATINLYPISDGGEGFLEIVSTIFNCNYYWFDVSNPIGNTISAPFLHCKEKNLGFIESATVLGQSLLTKKKKDPLITSTSGLGELIIHAHNRFPDSTWYVGLGGTSTVDGGKDACSIMGGMFLDNKGILLPPGGGSLVDLDKIIVNKNAENLRELKLQLVCDVKNPLLGNKGAVKTFGPQKGITPSQISHFENGFTNLSQKLSQLNRDNFIDQEGFGAAGGIPASFNAIFGWKLCFGASFISNLLNLPEIISKSDLVITGEGRFDKQSYEGKAPWNIIQLSQGTDSKVIVVAGSIEPKIETPENTSSYGIDPIGAPPPQSSKEASLKLENKIMEILTNTVF